MIVKSKQEAKSVIDALQSMQRPILMEDPVKNMVSVYVAEPEVVASVKKTTKEKDVVFGKGDIKKVKIDVETKQLALDAAKAIDAKVLRVDIALNSSPRVVNINLNPSLTFPSKITGVDIPKKIIESIHYNYEIHKEKPLLLKFFDDAKSVVKDVLKTKDI
jgi:glutathione synthase/RimK-type ligase-like ATP-grasp enzyme